MDLTSEQHARILRLIQDWSKDTTLELETTFGVKGVVDSNTFLQVAQRLRAKDFEMIPQDDRLSILTPNEVRISLQGLGVIQLYCKDDRLQNKNYTIMSKNRTSPDSNVDIREYDVRFKVRRESDLGREDPAVSQILSNWENQKKAFRLIRRWSFRGKGIRIDMSMIRQSPTLPSGEFQWATRFLQYNILNQPPRYEIEVELLHDTEYTQTPETTLVSLIRGVGEVLRAIQKNSLLIRNSVANKVRSEYQRVTGAAKFRGVGPVTLEIKNMKKEIEDGIPNVRSGYNVTDKADGLRAIGFVDQEGEFFLLDQRMNVYRTGLKNTACAHSIVDGEWVTSTADKTPINHYLIFDIYHANGGKNTWDLPFATFKEDLLDVEAPSRFNKMKEWYKLWSSNMEIIPKTVNPGNRLVMAIKRFEFASNDNDSIFRRGCASILDSSHLYHTDGLILTSNSHPLPAKAGVRFPQQFKWKPAIDNTIDFLIKYERHSELPMDKITTTVGQSDTIIQYKTMHLYVGSASRGHPRDIILNQLDTSKDTSHGYQAILFTPMEFPDTMANTCYIAVKQDPETLEFYSSTEDSNEPIPDCSVVEMRYDPNRDPGWRWVPARIRHDKTESLQKATEIARATNKAIAYSGVMNNEEVANSVWNSIHDPITDSMIRSGNEQPSDDEVQQMANLKNRETTKTYYLRNAPKENLALVKGLQDFHNTYIKNNILLQTALRTGKNVLDVACGKGGDLWKWINNGARTVLGIDYAGENITHPNDGAYSRYLQIKQRVHHRVPNVAFVIGNSSKRIITGEAGANQQEGDILRSVFGKENAKGALPPYIEKVMAGTFLQGADIVSCMFALHYFFESEATLDGFLTNLSETIKPGGLFIGCCFDGDSVFKKLRGMNMHDTKLGQEGDVTIWSITKEYDQTEFPPDASSVGLAIDVEFISIGSKYREYLVSFEYLKERLAKIGLRHLNEKELLELNLKHSTNTFDKSHEMATAQRLHYRMSDTVKEFSFLNRWFIFKRQDATELKEAAIPQILLEEPKEIVEEEPAVAAAEEEEKVESREFRLPPPDKKWEPQQVFSFGSSASTAKDILNVRLSNGQPDLHIGRWMAISAPFPIPDPLPNLNDPSAEPIPPNAVMYPTIEHYLAGMKLKHAATIPRRPGEPHLGELLMSENGDIHTKAKAEYMQEKRKKDFKEESDTYYKLLSKEAQQVRKFFTTKKTLNAHKAHVSDELWFPIRDEHLRNALHYRFKFDERFRKAVLAAKDMSPPKYMLHAKALTNNDIDEVKGGIASELYGKRDVQDKIILGKNKVGMMLMELAGFRF